MKKLRIIFEDYVVYANLLYDKIPRFLEAFEKELPVTGLIRHARVCDFEWELPVPFSLDVDERENLHVPQLGDIVYHRPGQTVCSWYSSSKSAPPLGEIQVFAKIDPADFAEYENRFKTIWLHPGRKVTLEIAEGAGK
jgi:hypothetical protein